VHTLQGRAISFAIGIKLANPELTVVVHGGDGDLLDWRGPLRRPRQEEPRRDRGDTRWVYGLTKGQANPTLSAGVKTKALPRPNLQDPVNPLLLGAREPGTRSWREPTRSMSRGSQGSCGGDTPLRRRGRGRAPALPPYNDLYAP